MSPTHDMIIDNSTGANVRADLNNALAALVSNSSSSSEPSTKYAYQFWADTTNGILKIRNSANNAWVELLQLDGTLTLEDGSASTPALAFRDDLNTGIFSSAADTFDIATAGTQRLTVDSSGNVGIGDTSPTAELSVAATAPHIDIGQAGSTRMKIGYEGNNCFFGATASTGMFIWKQNVDAEGHPQASGTERMRIDSSGNVGIGTTSPDSLLHVESGSATSARISGNRGNGDNLHIGNIEFENNFNTQGVIAEIKAITGSSGTQSTKGQLTFSTDDGTTFAERMRIDSSGNVGIGTTSPSSELEVVDTSGSSIIRVSGTSSGSTVTAQLLGSSSGYGIIGTTTNHALAVSTNNSERMRIDSSGKVGIGTTSPITPLHVVNSGSSTDAIISNSGNDSRLHIIAGTNQKNSIIRFGDPDDDNRGAIDYDHNGDSLSFRIAGTSDVLLFNSLGAATFNAGVPNANAFQMDNRSSTNPEGLYLRFSFAAPNNSTRHFLKCTDNVGDKAVIDSNGNSRNLNNSYAGFSDISLKENIVDANSQWDDIKNVKVRVFNFKTDDASDKRIGVVAQEIETVCPKLVEEIFDKDSDGNLLETSTKSVKYSVLYMKAIKALQEAITKIETLETKVAALEAA